MPTRPALWLALILVFAPGWQPGGAGASRDGEVLAARVLAPSFDEGLLRSGQTSDSKALHARAHDPPRTDAPPATPATLFLILGAGLGFAAAAHEPCHRRTALLFVRHADRAPPSLRPI